jgi:2-hydroxychromene-2-carboxylate isomerase
MDDAEIIVQSLNERGLDGKTFLARAAEPEVKARLMANTERSVARGTFGAPTFFVEDEIYFGKDKLRDVEEAIVEASG